MSNNLTHIDASTPTLSVKGVDNVPQSSLSIVHDDFKNYVYTGITVTIDTPLAYDSRRALFGINLDGFIPTWSVDNDLYFRNMYKNLFPVQSMVRAPNDGVVKIFQEQIMLPIQHKYFSNRFISGSVGVGIRVTSNTSQSGNLIISHATGVKREYYSNNGVYDGLEFANSSHNTTDYSTSNFVVADISLNRNVSILATRNDPVVAMDFPKKIDYLVNNYRSTISVNSANSDNVFASQFLEDWLLVGLISSLPNQNANKITLSIFFDFSRIFFKVPIFPIIPGPPTTAGKEILKYSDTVKINNFTKAQAIFLPETP